MKSIILFTPSRPPKRRFGPTWGLFTVAALLLAMVPRPGSAQAGSALGGALVGAAAGGFVSVAVITANARRGHFLFSPEQATWELIPIPALAVTAGIMGYQDRSRLWESVAWSAAGFAGGSALGALLGKAAWGDGEGAWAGGIVGGAVGLLVGGVVGAVTSERDQNPLPLSLLRVSVR